MRRGGALAVLAAVLIALPLSAAIAQEGGSEVVDLRIDALDTTNFPSVEITVTVPIELAGDTFTLDDFFVSENGEIREVEVEQLPTDRLAVVFALDTSFSMSGEPLAQAKSAISSFVQVMPPGVAFALVRFGSASELVVPFTTQPDEIVTAVDALAAAGETALYDAIIESSSIIGDLSGVRRSLILLSDGGDTASVASLEESIVGLLQAESEFIAIELQSPENDSAALERLEVASQGAVVPASPDALADIFGGIASDLLNQFRITYTAAVGGQTELTVAVRGATVAAINTSNIRFADLPEATVPPPPSTATPTTTAAPVLAAPVGSPIELPWYQTSGALGIAAIAIFLGIFGVVALARPQRENPGVVAMRGIAPRARGASRATVLSGLADRASVFAEEAITASGSASGLRIRLDQAGLNLRVGELGVIVLAAGLAGFFIGIVIGGILGGLIAAAIAVALPFAAITAIASFRARRFRDQLANTLQLIAGALRAGFGIGQAIDSVVAEAPEPTASEFNRVRLEVQLGRELEAALATMADRVQSEDLHMAAEAIEIHRQIGGDLSELLDRVAATIRERETVRRQIQVLSAEGRLSAIVLISLPLFIAAAVQGVAPDYLDELTDTGVGQVLIVIGIGLLVIGMLWIRRIVRLEY